MVASHDKEYGQQKIQLLNLANGRWNWNAYNTKIKMEESHEDLFDVQMEEQIQRNQERKPIPYEIGCASQIAAHEKLSGSEKTKACASMVPKNKKLVVRMGGRLPIKLYIMAKCPWYVLICLSCVE
jgi:hypothetical protein